MADIFLSYASVDVDKARHLAKGLEQYGSVFWDRTIPTGKTWRQHIGSALKSARCVVVAWSNASIESTWVQDEVDDARERGVPIFPVFFDGVRAPLGFRSVQGKDLSKWDYSPTYPVFREFLADVAAFLNPAPPHTDDVTATSAPEKEKAPPTAVKLRVLAAVLRTLASHSPTHRGYCTTLFIPLMLNLKSCISREPPASNKMFSQSRRYFYKLSSMSRQRALAS